MSGKHGPLSIGYNPYNIPTSTKVDPNLYLSGEFSSECLNMLQIVVSHTTCNIYNHFV